MLPSRLPTIEALLLVRASLLFWLLILRVVAEDAKSLRLLKSAGADRDAEDSAVYKTRDLCSKKVTLAWWIARLDT